MKDFKDSKKKEAEEEDVKDKQTSDKTGEETPSKKQKNVGLDFKKAKEKREDQKTVSKVPTMKVTYLGDLTVGNITVKKNEISLDSSLIISEHTANALTKYTSSVFDELVNTKVVVDVAISDRYRSIVRSGLTELTSPFGAIPNVRRVMEDALFRVVDDAILANAKNTSSHKLYTEILTSKRLTPEIANALSNQISEYLNTMVSTGVITEEQRLEIVSFNSAIVYDSNGAVPGEKKAKTGAGSISTSPLTAAVFRVMVAFANDFNLAKAYSATNPVLAFQNRVIGTVFQQQVKQPKAVRKDLFTIENIADLWDACFAPELTFVQESTDVVRDLTNYLSHFAKLGNNTLMGELFRFALSRKFAKMSSQKKDEGNQISQEVITLASYYYNEFGWDKRPSKSETNPLFSKAYNEPDTESGLEEANSIFSGAVLNAYLNKLSCNDIVGINEIGFWDCVTTLELVVLCGYNRYNPIRSFLQIEVERKTRPNAFFGYFASEYNTVSSWTSVPTQIFGKMHKFAEFVSVEFYRIINKRILTDDYTTSLGSLIPTGNLRNLDEMSMELLNFVADFVATILASIRSAIMSYISLNGELIDKMLPEYKTGKAAHFIPAFSNTMKTKTGINEVLTLEEDIKLTSFKEFERFKALLLRRYPIIKTKGQHDNTRIIYFPETENAMEAWNYATHSFVPSDRFSYAYKDLSDHTLESYLTANFDKLPFLTPITGKRYTYLTKAKPAMVKYLSDMFPIMRDKYNKNLLPGVMKFLQADEAANFAITSADQLWGYDFTVSAIFRTFVTLDDYRLISDRVRRYLELNNLVQFVPITNADDMRTNLELNYSFDYLETNMPHIFAKYFTRNLEELKTKIGNLAGNLTYVRDIEGVYAKHDMMFRISVDPHTLMFMDDRGGLDDGVKLAVIQAFGSGLRLQRVEIPKMLYVEVDR